MDLADLVDPAHTALCVVECQNGVVGPASSIPAVAAAVADADLLARLGTLAAVARSVGVRVVHCTFRSRADLWGGNRNSRLFAAARKSDVQQVERTAAVEPAAELGFDADVDVVVSMGCGDECPVYPGTRRLDWQLEDPAGQGVEMVRGVRDKIRILVGELLEDLLDEEDS